MTACFYSAASSIGTSQVEVSGVDPSVLFTADSASPDTTAESQNYRPHNYRPTNYNTGYNRRPYYPSYNNNNGRPTYQQQASPAYNKPTYYTSSSNNNNRPPAAYNNAIQNPSTRQQSPASGISQSRASCSATSGTYEQWGVCWNHDTKQLEINKSKLTPFSFGQFYKYVSMEGHLFANRAYHAGVCQTAKETLNNQVVMCASYYDCANERGVSYYESCVGFLCTCVVDDRLGPTTSDLLATLPAGLPAWTIPHAVAGLQMAQSFLG